MPRGPFWLTAIGSVVVLDYFSPPARPTESTPLYTGPPTLEHIRQRPSAALWNFTCNRRRSTYGKLLAAAVPLAVRALIGHPLQFDSQPSSLHFDAQRYDTHWQQPFPVLGPLGSRPGLALSTNLHAGSRPMPAGTLTPRAAALVKDDTHW